MCQRRLPRLSGEWWDGWSDAGWGGILDLLLLSCVGVGFKLTKLAIQAPQPQLFVRDSPSRSRRRMEAQRERLARLEAANTATVEDVVAHQCAANARLQHQSEAVDALRGNVTEIITHSEELQRQRAAPKGGDKAGSKGLPNVLDEFMEATSGCLQLHERRMDELLVSGGWAASGAPF